MFSHLLALQLSFLLACVATASLASQIMQPVPVNPVLSSAPSWLIMSTPFYTKKNTLTSQVVTGDTIEIYVEKSDSNYVIVKFGQHIITPEAS